MLLPFLRSRALQNGAHRALSNQKSTGKIRCAVCRNWVTPNTAPVCLIEYECNACGHLKYSKALKRVSEKVASRAAEKQHWSKPHRAQPPDENGLTPIKGIYDPNTGENRRKGQPRFIRPKSS